MRRKALPEPDGWMRLVLKSMVAQELRDAIAVETDPDKLRWLRAELRMKENQ